jgi:hypothetical protein
MEYLIMMGKYSGDKVAKVGDWARSLTGFFMDERVKFTHVYCSNYCYFKYNKYIDMYIKYNII